MQSKRPTWLTLVLIMIFGSTATFAHAAPQQGPPKTPPPAQPSITPINRDAQRAIPGAYRLTYTLTDMEATRQVGSQSYKVVLDADAQPVNVDLRASVPVPMGNNGNFSREDTGLSIFARMRQFANGMELKTTIHQTVFAGGTKSQAAANSLPPITRQAELSTTALLTENKIMTIGEMDIPGSTHSLRVQVELTRVH